MLENEINLPALIGENVLWLGSGSGKAKPGKVRWIGKLPEISENWAIGLELDEALPFGGIDGKWGPRKLFHCKQKHGLLVPASQVITIKYNGRLTKDVSTNFKNEVFTGHESYRNLGFDTFCGSFNSYVRPKPAVRKKHQQLHVDKRNDYFNRDYSHVEQFSETLSKNIQNPLSNENLSVVPVIRPRNRNVLKFCKLFDYDEPISIILDNQHLQHCSKVKRSTNVQAVLNFNSQIEGNQNGGVRIGKTMSALHGDEMHNDLTQNNDPTKVSSLKVSKKRLFSKSNSFTNTNISADSSLCSDSSGLYKRNSGLFSFFRWFNKDKNKSNSLDDNHRFPSEPASPRFLRSQDLYSGSIDSVFSTATCNSFFYVSPSCYKSKLVPPVRRIAPEAETDTYCKRIKQIESAKGINENLSLKRKYKILGSAVTLNSSIDNLSENEQSLTLGSCKNIQSLTNSTLDRKKRQAPSPPALVGKSSPLVSSKVFLSEKSNHVLKNHRRCSSESAKDKKAGAYYHVKGKRKAPQPPVSLSNKNKTLPKDISIGCLNKKKRIAPQPPKRKSAIFISDINGHDTSINLKVPCFDEIKFDRPINEPVTKLKHNTERHTINLVLASNHRCDLHSGTSFDFSGSHIGSDSCERKKTSVEVKEINEEPISILNVANACKAHETIQNPRVDIVNTLAEGRNCEVVKNTVISEDENQKLSVDFDKFQADRDKHFSFFKVSCAKKEMAFSVCNDSLKLEKGILKQNKLSSASDNTITEKVITPSSPVTPRPWYKRNAQSNISAQNNKIPLLDKLKSLERRKEDAKDLNESTDMSITRKVKASGDSGNILNLIPSGTTAQNSESKRRSQLSILTNISELDRQAAEIVRNERLRTKELASAENEKFYDSNLELPSYYEAEVNVDDVNATSNSTSKKTTRDLISLFNAISNVTRVTVNTAFFSRDLHLFSKENVDKKSTFSNVSKSSTKNSEKMKKLGIESSKCTSPIAERKRDSETFLNSRALDEKDRKCDVLFDTKTTEEIDLRRAKIQELLEISRMKYHHLPSQSIPTITEQSESFTCSTTASPVSTTATFPPTEEAPPIPVAPSIEEMNDSKAELIPTPNGSVWSCAVCTLDNPRWKILCDACHSFRSSVSSKFIESQGSHKNVDASLNADVNESSAKPLASDETKNTKFVGVANDNPSQLVEAPPINFETAKMKFSCLKNEEAIVNKTVSTSSSRSSPFIKISKNESEVGKLSSSKNNADCISIKDPAAQKNKQLLMSEYVKISNDNTSCTPVIPVSVSSLKDETIVNTNTKEEKHIRDKIVLSENEIDSTEIRKARLAFFENKSKGDIAENNLNRKIVNGLDQVEDNNLKANEPSEKDKLKMMLKAMKYSLDMRVEAGKEKTVAIDCHDLKEEKRFGAIKKIKRVDLNHKEMSRKKVEDFLKKIDQEKTAELYLVKNDAIFEDIKIKDEKLSKLKEKKVSTSVQTNSFVRKADSFPNNFDKPPDYKHVNSSSTRIIAPVVIEDYNIKNGVVYSSIKKEGEQFGLSTFKLIQARDFANFKNSKKPSNDALFHTYANTPSDSSCVSESYSQILDSTNSKGSDILLKSKLSDRADFTSSTSSSSIKSPENVTTLAVNRLLRRLETAIANGQHHQAATLAKELARLKISCSVVRQKPVDANVTVSMFVEDKVSHQGPIPLVVNSNMKISDLKLKVNKEFEIPIQFQRWILGQQLVTNDNCTLQHLGVDSPGCPFFLYLVAPESAVEDPVRSSLKIADKAQNSENISECKNTSEEFISSSALTSTIAFSEVAEDNSVDENTESNISDILVETVEEDISEDFNDDAVFSLSENLDNLLDVKGNSDNEKSSSSITGFSVCAEIKPPNCLASNSLSGNLPSPAEDKEQVTAETKLSNYHELLNLDKSDLVPNVDEFECPVCLSVFKPQEGVVLRECLHTFCRVCLANIVQFCEEPEVKCPFRDSNYSCDSALQEREIKALVTQEQYEFYLAKSIAQAETKIRNAFHCKTPDCRGWCIYEDNVNDFLCPVCSCSNCLTCQAIHTGINCRQYQEQMKQESETNVDAKRTRDMLEEMVERGEAMACPTCQVVLMKKWGCDWVRCSMCKTEICWVRRCARWGPKGRGDTSGGCQCGVNGVKCHPKCTYCH